MYDGYVCVCAKLLQSCPTMDIGMTTNLQTELLLEEEQLGAVGRGLMRILETEI